MKKHRIQISLIAASLILFTSFGVFYKDVIINLIETWMHDGNYSHGFFVPVIVGYMIWSNRKEFKNLPVKTFWPAIILIAFAGLLLIAGQLTIHRFAKHFSLFLMICSITLLIFGKNWFWKLKLPLIFLVFMFPLPEFFRRNITYPLQILSSYISVNFLDLLGYPIYREGNIIMLPDTTLSVAEACSGLRSLVALTFLAAIAGYFVLKSNWKRLILFLCAFPIAVILNWIRITGTVLLTNHWGLDAALGFFHNFSGLIIFGLAAVSIGAIMLYLKRKDIDSDTSNENAQTNALSARSVNPISIALSSGILVLLLIYGNFLFSLKPPPLSLQKLPLKIGNYAGEERHIDPDVTKKSFVTEDRSITYFNSDKPPIGVYLGYYRTGKELKGFFHGSDVCLPGAGWQIIKKEKIPIYRLENQNDAIYALKYVSSKMGSTEVMFTWLQSGKLVGTGTRAMRFKLAMDTIINLRYYDTTKIMVQTTVSTKESETEATARLLEFIKLFYPRFSQLVS